MRFSRNDNAFQDKPERPESGRRSGRLKCESIVSQMGRVLDISATGVRMRVKRKPSIAIGESGMVDLRIKRCDCEPISVRLEVCWFKKVGFRAYDIGGKFLDVDDATKKRITELAREGSPCRVIAA